MSLLRGLLGRSTPRRLKTSSLLSPSEGYAPPSQDTLAAIAELSQMVKNNPDAIEIYLALGNLYRSRGEIERAVQIRNNLIVRPGLDKTFKARALFELGLDYKRGGFYDRAQAAFEDARGLIGDDPAILGELARLAAEGKDYDRAAQIYALLGKPIPQAHYLVRCAHQKAQDDPRSSRKWLDKALQVYPGSVEAHLELLTRAYAKHDWDRMGKIFSKALESVPEELRFLLLEGLMQHVVCQNNGNGDTEGVSIPPTSPVLPPECCEALLPVIEAQQNDLLLYFYGAWLLIQAGDYDKAKTDLEKTLLLNPDFWPARLELLSLTLDEQTLTPVFKGQLEFFLKHARRVKRFVCTKCGLKRERIFFVCPRCQSWHSISFRRALND